MKKIEKRYQVVAIYARKYDVVFNSKDRTEAVNYAKKVRAKLMADGALKVITNIGRYYETK